MIHDAYVRDGNVPFHDMVVDQNLGAVPANASSISLRSVVDWVGIMPWVIASHSVSTAGHPYRLPGRCMGRNQRTRRT